MHIQFNEPTSGPEHLLSEVELHFTEQGDPLEGLKLCGVRLWCGDDGKPYVTMPARPRGTGESRSYFDYLRSIRGVLADVTPLKRRIIQAWADYKA